MRVDFRTVAQSLTAFGAAAILMTACGGDSPSGPPANSVAKVLESLSVEGGGTATLKTGTVPAASGGPTASATTSSAIAQGGTGEVVVSSSSAFRKIYVSVDGKVGFYEITLPANVTLATLLATYGTTESGAVTVNYAVANAAGAIGSEASTSVNIVNVGTGDVQVTLSWNTRADVDLHVVDPSGEEVFYGNDVAASGGTLDLDSNVGCVEEGRAENITWNSAPPRGTYIVRVDYYDECNATSTDYVVTVRRKGRAAETFTGTFTGAGTGGGLGDGRQITTFTY